MSRYRYVCCGSNYYVSILLCRECLHDHIMVSDNAKVYCPENKELACGGSITELEMRGVCLCVCVCVCVCVCL